MSREKKAEIKAFHDDLHDIMDGLGTMKDTKIAEAFVNKGWRKQSEGEWVVKNIFFAIYKCSICGAENLYKDGHACLSKFCSECGARMKGGAE